MTLTESLYHDRPTLWRAGPTAPKVILDTNVLLDVYTCADLADEYSRPNADVMSERSIYRRARARESLLLAVYLHETRSATWSLPNETTKQVLLRAPPKELDDPKVHFTWIFVNYIKDRALSGWEPRLSTRGDEGLVGDACDDYLVHVARLNRVPIITNEGSSMRGINESHGLRKKAKQAGVQVFTPREYWQGKFNPRRASRRFIRNFLRGGRKFIRKRGGSPVLAKAFGWIDGYFHHVLYGIAADGVTRLPVEV